ncbi:hypothetical protein ACMFMG_002466 [Clarireedia jacksonii]
MTGTNSCSQPIIMSARTSPRHTFSKQLSPTVSYSDESDIPCPTLLQLLRNQDTASDLIAHKAASLPWIGPPKGEVKIGETGYSQTFTDATIFAQADALGQATSAFEVHGEILERYIANHGEEGKLGYPLTDEMWTPDHKCRFNKFTRGALFWTATTGVSMICGEIYKKWMSVDGLQGIMGYPISDECWTPGGVTRFNKFSNGGAIYCTATRGAFLIYGDIYKKWYSEGGERGVLGYPISDEASTIDGLYRFNNFSNGGAIYWIQERGPVRISGDIYKKWMCLGGELSCLGYPLIDERQGRSNTRYSNFSNGSIWWHPSIGTRKFCGRATNYNIVINQFDIHEMRSTFIDTLYITAFITSASVGVKSATVPLGDHTSGFVYPDLKFFDCGIADEEIATLAYLVIHNGSNDQADVIKKLEIAMLKIGTAVAEIVPNSPGPEPTEQVIGDSIGTAIGTTRVPTDGTAVGAFAGCAASGGLGMSFLNCDGVVAARVVPLRGSDLKAHLILGNQWRVVDKHLGTDSAEGCGPISHYNVLWNLEFS